MAHDAQQKCKDPRKNQTVDIRLCAPTVTVCLRKLNRHCTMIVDEENFSKLGNKFPQIKYWGKSVLEEIRPGELVLKIKEKKNKVFKFGISASHILILFVS